MRQITIQNGFEYRTSTINIYDDKEFLYPQYCRAARCIDEIVDASVEFENTFEQKTKRKTNRSGTYRSLQSQKPVSMFAMNEKQWLKGYPNNIIAFCARRGQGKTSAMLSMSKALENLPISDGDLDFSKTQCAQIVNFWNQAHDRTTKPPVCQSVNHYSFFVIDPIDPTTMEQTDSVLRNILFRMLDEVNEIAEKDESDDNTVEYRKLLTCFRKTFRNLKALKQTNVSERFDSYDDLAELSESGDSGNLKKSIYELVRNFLSFVKYDMLVIQIDDADLNTSRSYEIIEDIRKYCVAPHILVMMAVHLGTLRTCIEQEYVKRYQYLLSTNLAISRMDENKCREMTERYIDKLLPGKHPVHLPYFDELFREGRWTLGLRYLHYSKEENKEVDSLDFSECGENMQHRLFQLLYQKTGIVLMPPIDYLHNFLPRRFRELTHFLSVFVDMENIDANGEGSLEKLLMANYGGLGMTEEQQRLLTIRRNNLDHLENYFLQHWCAYTLEKAQYQIMENIAAVPYGNMNKKVLDQLKSYCGEALAKSGFDYPSYDSHPTFSLVFHVLDNIKNKLDIGTKFEFVYAVEMYYTIRLNKCMCAHLESGDGFEELGQICGKEVFYENLLYANAEEAKEDIRSVQLLRAMSPASGIMDVGWCNFFEPLEYEYIYRRYQLDHTRELLLSQKVSNSTKNWTLNQDVKWFRFSINRMLFNLINNGEILDRRKPEAKKGNKDAFAGVDSVLMLICNFDMQYRLKKYAELRRRDIGTEYLKRIDGIGQRFDEVFGKNPNCSPAPEQALVLNCQFQKAFYTLSGDNQSASFQLALELARPDYCLEQFVLLMEKVKNALINNVSTSDSDWQVTLAENLRNLQGDQRDSFELLQKIKAFSNGLNYCQKELLNADLENMTVAQYNQVYRKINKIFSKASQRRQKYDNLDELVQHLQDANWISSQG